ncbi:uncharacterized protein Ms4a19 isoform X3 [Rattus norvegicus]|uniref:uncharacterized protein Ms4a19 isoform X3 n=1 Tax=Rattus norvegicus TaxID=10116 RepID=UPI00191768C3|nr:uncharacterized protein Ms4a19 isoform X3 [Rattus norvegicus]
MNMPQNRLWIKKELRLLGVIQLITSLIVQSLGYFWTYLFFSQTIVFGLGSNYPPITGSSGYPLWASLLLIWTLTMNVLSIFATLIGVFLATFELIITSRLDSSLWQHVDHYHQ